MLVNGKREWPDALRHRYEELVNTPNGSVNKQGSSGFLPAKLSEAMVGRQGFEPWTPGLKVVHNIAESAVSVNNLKVLNDFIRDRAARGLSPNTIRFYTEKLT